MTIMFVSPSQELRSLTKGRLCRAYVSNISFNFSVEDMITMVNKRGKDTNPDDNHC